MNGAIGHVGGRVGKRLAAVEERVVEAEQRHRFLQREHQAAQEGAARLDGQLVKLEAAELAGQGDAEQIKAARKAHDAALKEAGRPWARELEVAERAAGLVRAEWQRFITENARELIGELVAEGEQVVARLDQARAELVAAAAAYSDLEMRSSRLATVAEGTDPRTVSRLPQAMAELQRDAKRAADLGVDVPVPALPRVLT